MKRVKATSNSNYRYADPRDCECFISYREIWQKAPRATARKVTNESVNWIAIDESDGDFYIFQIAGYSHDRGLFNYQLDRNGRIIA